MFIFCHDMVNALTLRASDSGRHKTNLSNLLFILVAKRSSSGAPKILHNFVNISGYRAHCNLLSTCLFHNQMYIQNSCYVFGHKPNIFCLIQIPNLNCKIIA